ncbi:hypothetical protein K438DRAFT_1768211 [Mycena galopus ATCC 62051]|nr:hypothetical protein K438DRAFT_1768211 [Mycena galopus ATCC 62051]
MHPGYSQCHDFHLCQHNEAAGQMDVDEGVEGQEDEGSQDGWLLEDGSSDVDEGTDTEEEEWSEVFTAFNRLLDRHPARPAEASTGLRGPQQASLGAGLGAG